MATSLVPRPRPTEGEKGLAISKRILGCAPSATFKIVSRDFSVSSTWRQIAREIYLEVSSLVNDLTQTVAKT